MLCFTQYMSLIILLRKVLILKLMKQFIVNPHFGTLTDPKGYKLGIIKRFTYNIISTNFHSQFNAKILFKKHNNIT